MPNEEVLPAKNDPPFEEVEQEKAEDIQRLRSMTVDERLHELGRLYAEGKKIKRTAEEIAAEEAEDAEIRERWNRLRRAYLGEI